MKVVIKPTYDKDDWHKCENYRVIKFIMWSISNILTNHYIDT